MDNQYSITCEKVGKSIAKKEIIKDISLNVSKGEIFGLLGPSGAGKTTLVKMIAGIDHPTNGTVHVLSQSMPNLDVMNDIGYMAQSDALYGELTAKENLEFFASLYGISGKKQKERILEVMGIVNLTGDLNKIVSTYSGGMKRRLSLAISILHEPEILILDEPTVGIDPVLRKSIWDELRMISDKGTTIIVTTHVMDEADKCNRIAMMRNGSLIATGTPNELKETTSSTTIEDAFLYYGRNK
ncbi:ABC transporter ATP-binding protein [Ferdinandcohnia quinoae]|uniref:ABC transporter ATP-binding protein n=1 Tax=Fredinandcohnia quinoae TaxID=2918902 RepID=A0AAW5E4E1_9BACI|nr:ABC transporter ATP-binding protein [Fredinandcohnia sp. SECRCQ15]MCH1627811.1 ABC transporter ATP-binding protein [Fredinandcohnia sp. SECRCQ15]